MSSVCRLRFISVSSLLAEVAAPASSEICRGGGRRRRGGARRAGRAGVGGSVPAGWVGVGGGPPGWLGDPHLFVEPGLRIPAVLLGQGFVLRPHVVQQNREVHTGRRVHLHVHVASGRALQNLHFLWAGGRAFSSATQAGCIKARGSALVGFLEFLWVHLPGGAVTPPFCIFCLLM